MINRQPPRSPKARTPAAAGSWQPLLASLGTGLIRRPVKVCEGHRRYLVAEQGQPPEVIQAARNVVAVQPDPEQLLALHDHRGQGQPPTVDRRLVAVLG